MATRVGRGEISALARNIGRLLCMKRQNRRVAIGRPSVLTSGRHLQPSSRQAWAGADPVRVLFFLPSVRITNAAAPRDDTEEQGRCAL